MRTFITAYFIAAASFTQITWAAENKSPPTPSPRLYVDGSLCTKPDQIVFSCPLAKSGKVVSICAAGSAEPHRFYYAFGKPDVVEMNHPSDTKNSRDTFARSFLGYTGGAGGYAYSFVNKGAKYIVYSISGKLGLNAGGVIVQKVGDIHALIDMKCSKGRIKEAADQMLLDETLRWKVDDDINGRALPDVK